MTGGQRRSSIDWSVAPPAVTPDALDEADQMRDNWWCALSPSSAARRYQPYQPGLYSRCGARVDAVTAGLYADPQWCLRPCS